MTQTKTRYYFVTSLKAKHNAEDWPLVIKMLKETIGSLQRQTEPNFRLLIACQDDPDIASFNDERFVWLPFAAEPPLRGDGKAANVDKKAKIIHIGNYLRKAKADDFYVTYLDADDLVVKHLVSTVLDRDNQTGFLFKTGYVFDSERHILKLMKDRFDKDCGTSSAIYMRFQDLPTSDEDAQAYFVNMSRHAYASELANQKGLVLEDFPHPAALYIINHVDSLQRLKNGLKAGRGEPVEPREAEKVLREKFGWPEGAALFKAQAE